MLLLLYQLVHQKEYANEVLNLIKKMKKSMIQDQKSWASMSQFLKNSTENKRSNRSSDKQTNMNMKKKNNRIYKISLNMTQKLKNNR